MKELTMPKADDEAMDKIDEAFQVKWAKERQRNRMLQKQNDALAAICTKLFEDNVKLREKLNRVSPSLKNDPENP